MVATLGPPPDRTQEISYTNLRVIGNGSFGVVYQAKLVDNNDNIAIKKVLQDKRFKVSCLGWVLRHCRNLSLLCVCCGHSSSSSLPHLSLPPSFSLSVTSLPVPSLPSTAQNRELQIMRRLDHCNIIRLQFFFYSNGDGVRLSRSNTHFSSFILIANAGC